jgi:hypothetical protein
LPTDAQVGVFTRESDALVMMKCFQEAQAEMLSGSN